MSAEIDQFLNGSPFAVVGASVDRDKYGNKVLRCYLQNDIEVFPVNPRADEVEGLKSFPDLTSIGVKLHGISIVTQPSVTEKVIEEAQQLGIKHIWMQPGAESEIAIQLGKLYGMSLIAQGPCILVALGYRESA